MAPWLLQRTFYPVFTTNTCGFESKWECGIENYVETKWYNITRCGLESRDSMVEHIKENSGIGTTTGERRKVRARACETDTVVIKQVQAKSENTLGIWSLAGWEKYWGSRRKRVLGYPLQNKTIGTAKSIHLTIGNC